MKRRYFLRLAALSGTAMVALPSLGYVTISHKEAAIGLIFNELSYLKLDRAGVEQYVEDYFKTHATYESLQNQVKIKTYYYLNMKSEDSGLVADLVHYYLLSSDFFLNKMDEKKTVKYLGAYNPYATPCSNPFSSLYYS